MTSPDERIKMAEELRGYADGLGDRIDSADSVEMILLGTIRHRDADGVVSLPTSHASLIAMLADLIEPQERTCRILQAYGDESEELDHRMEEIAGTPEDTVACICQSCGHEFRYDRMVRPRFCPHCGARVVVGGAEC